MMRQRLIVSDKVRYVTGQGEGPGEIGQEGSTFFGIPVVVDDVPEGYVLVVSTLTRNTAQAGHGHGMGRRSTGWQAW